MSGSQELINVDQVSDITEELIQSLITSHKSYEGYLISFKLLELYTKLGYKCAKFHRVFRYKQGGHSLVPKL